MPMMMTRLKGRNLKCDALRAHGKQPPAGRTGGRHI
jgi:hypothetical protein